MLRTPSDFDRAYLACSDSRGQSGFHGSAERWRAARRRIVDGIDGDGTFLDVGCANGLLMESVAERSPFHVEPYGVDFAPGLADLARQRWGDRIFHADLRWWKPPFRFEFVHVRFELWHEKVLRFGRRVIVSSDGSCRLRESPRAEAVGARLRELGLDPCGERYDRDDRHLVELAVAWVDVTQSN
jgi:hypothetical protein